MKLKQSRLAAQVMAAIAACPPDVTRVYIPAAYADLFRRVPKNGREYLVQDPNSRRVLHWTHTDGSYERIDDGKLTVKVEVRRTRSKKPKKRIAGRDAMAHVRTVKPDAAPEICLIDLPRVMQICGFRRSFVYERADFPKPIRLGTAQRSAVRWVESEIVAWTRAQVAARDISAT